MQKESVTKCKKQRFWWLTTNTDFSRKKRSCGEIRKNISDEKQTNMKCKGGAKTVSQETNRTRVKHIYIRFYQPQQNFSCGRSHKPDNYMKMDSASEDVVIHGCTAAISRIFNCKTPFTNNIKMIDKQKTTRQFLWPYAHCTKTLQKPWLLADYTDSCDESASQFGWAFSNFIPLNHEI